jgi:hypothetical protein
MQPLTITLCGNLTVAWTAPDTATLTCDCGERRTETVLRNEFQWFQIAADSLRRQHPLRERR